MPTNRLLAYAQLLRLPNVFTAFADILMAACAAGYVFDQPDVLFLLLGVTGCLYLGGMVWNDYFDRREDAKTQPFRPIPSGRVSARTASLLAYALVTTGLLCYVPVYMTNVRATWLLPAALVTAIFAYDVWLKRTPVGPLGMGLCRLLNVLLGLSVAPQMDDGLRYHLAGIVGLYIVGVTWFARTEEAESNRRQLVLASLVMLAALGLAVTVPAHLPSGTSPVYFPFLIVVFGAYIGSALVTAIRTPGPKPVQAAVKRCILGLVLLDAALASAFVGWPGLLLVLLLLPARRLGKWVYST